MNTSRIEKLLEIYFEGMTTLAEEQELKDFFARADLPSHLKHHQSMFSFFSGEQKKTISDPLFGQKVTEKINAVSDEPRVIMMTPLRRKMGYAFGIAASILLLIGLFFTFRHEFKKPPESIASLNYDPAIAYTDVQEALLMVSGNMNFGMEQVEKLEKVAFVMHELEVFSKFYQYQSIIINPDEVNNPSKK